MYLLECGEEKIVLYLQITRKPPYCHPDTEYSEVEGSYPCGIGQRSFATLRMTFQKAKKMTNVDKSLHFEISNFWLPNPDFCTIGNLKAQNPVTTPQVNAPCGNLKGTLGNITERLVTLEGHLGTLND